MKPSIKIKRTISLVAGLLAFAQAAPAAFIPMDLTPASFTADVVVEKEAPPPIGNFTTGSMDGGTNNSGSTFYEQGYLGFWPSTGLPPAGATFAAEADANRQYQMAPSYSANNVLLIYTNAIPSGSLNLSTPAAYSVLSVFSASAGGGATISYTVHYQGGAIQEGTIQVNDWFNSALEIAHTVAARVSLNNASVDAINNTSVRLTYADIFLSDSVTPVVGVDFATTSTPRVAIFGISGSTDGVTYAPLSLTGYNRDVVIEATAPKSGNVMDKTTVTMDSGSPNNTANTWYELGFNTDNPATGLPVAGSTLTVGNHSYQMPPTYTGNCAMYIANFGTYTSGTLTLSSPAAYSALSFLSSAGNGPVEINIAVHHADFTIENLSFSSIDWFNSATAIYSAMGRVDPANMNFASVNNSGGTKLFASDVNLASSSPVTQIDFSYVSGGRSAIFAVSGNNGSGTFTPVAVTGYNADPVVEATPPFPPNGLLTATTASMDRGLLNFQNTWMEQGYYNYIPTAGLPPAGSTFFSISKPDHQYRLPASYTQNNAAFVDSTFTNVNLTPVTPGVFTALSFLSATANGRVTNQCIMQYQDGTSETNNFVSEDWFNNSPYAFAALGRVNLSRRTVDNDPGRTSTPNPRLYEAEFPLLNAASPLTNIVLKFLGSQNANGRMVVMGVSSSTDPVAPIFATYPSSLRTMTTSNVVLAATIRGGATPMTFQWYGNPGGTFVPLANGGVVSGADTTDLTFTGITTNYQADYYLVASNVAGSVTSLTATVTVLLADPDVTQPGDQIVAYQPNGGNSPAGEAVIYAIDNTTSKYLNFSQNPNPFVGPIGFVVEPSIGKTTVGAMRLYTANDAADRDPTDYVLEGSNDGGSTWTTISSGSLALPGGRNNGGLALAPITQNIQEVRFANAVGYKMYRWSCNTVNGAPFMQIGEVELLGQPTPEPPSIVQQPVPEARVFVGANPAFSIRATGYPTNFNYQWYVNGSTPIAGATSRTYTLNNAQLSDSGKTFHCAVTNSQGFAISSSGSLTVIAAPTGTYPTTIMADTPTAFWRLNETDDGLLNNGKPAYDYFGGHSGIYSNVVLGQPGFSINDTDPSGSFGNQSPTFFDSYIGDISGIDFGKPTNNNVAFSVEAWIQAGTQLYDAGIVCKGPGGGGEQFCLDTGGSAADEFGVRFYVRTAAGNAVVANTGTNKLDDPTAWHHLVGVCDQANSNVLLYVDGRLDSKVSIAPFAGLLGSTEPVAIGSRRSNSATNYNNQFYGLIDEVAIYSYALSSNQVLSHYYAAGIAPRFTIEPTNSSFAEGATATFYSSALGTPNLSYQWSSSVDGFNFTPINGETGPILTIENVPASVNGTFYRVTVDNTYGTVTSAAAQLTVLSGPPIMITDVVAAKVVYAGRAFSLSASFGGTPPLSYSWQKNGAPLSNGGRISGATSNTVTISNAQPSDAGSYQLFVSNPQGNASSSPAAVIVEVAPDFNTNGLGWSLQGIQGTLPSPAYITNDVVVLTEGLGSTARSAFFEEPLYIGAFMATFTYQNLTQPTGSGADGVALVLQNSAEGPAALGGNGGGLGYTGITPSAALMFNIYNGSGIAVGVNGTRLAAYTSTAPVGINGGNEIDVTVYYNQGVASVELYDNGIGIGFSTSVEIDLMALLGPTAYVGVTGADGGTASTQVIKNFNYIPLPALMARQDAPGTVTIYWPASIGGYALEGRASLTTGSWQPVATPVVQTGGMNEVTVSATANQFYRLVLAQP